MRWLYAGIGLIGGALSLVAAYLFFMFAMFMGGGSGTVGNLLLYVIIAVLIAALLNLIAAFLNPRRVTSRRMLILSAAVWPLGGILLGLARYFDAEVVTLTNTLLFAGMLAAPALLPLGAWLFARWKFSLG